MRLNAVGAADDQDRAVQNGHGALGLGGEIHVPRRVYQRHGQVLRLKARLLGKDGNAPLTLQIMGIQKRIPMVNPSQRASCPGAVQQCFAQGGLPRIHMGK